MAKGAVIRRTLWACRVRGAAAWAVRAFYARRVTTVRQRLASMLLDTELHALTGHNAQQVCKGMSHLFWVVMEAARLGGLSATYGVKTACILAADALVIVRDKPRRLPMLRHRIRRGIDVLHEVCALLAGWELVEAERNLRTQMLCKGRMWSQDLTVVRRAA